MRKKICLVLLFGMLFAYAKAQQDPQFTFYKQAELLYNPSMAGVGGEVSGVFLNRNQWSGIDGAPATMLLSASLPADFISANSGVGINMMRDEIGFESTILVNLNYSYKISQSWGVIGLGLSFGLFNKGIDGDWYVPGGSGYSGSDNLLPDGEVSEIAIDAGFGAHVETGNAFLGLGVTHLNEAEIEISDLSYTFYKRHYYLSGGYDFKLSNPLFAIGTAFLYKSDLASSQLDLNADVRYKERFTGGIGYRLDDGLIFRFTTKLNNGIQVGYAYDATTSALSAYSGGSHEFFVGYSFSLYKKKAKAYKSVRYL